MHGWMLNKKVKCSTFNYDAGAIVSEENFALLEEYIKYAASSMKVVHLCRRDNRIMQMLMQHLAASNCALTTITVFAWVDEHSTLADWEPALRRILQNAAAVLHTLNMQLQVNWEAHFASSPAPFSCPPKGIPMRVLGH